MPRRYRTLRYILNGHSEQETARALGVSQASVSRDLSQLAETYPGLLCAIDVIKRAHQGEAGGLAEAGSSTRQPAIATG